MIVMPSNNTGFEAGYFAGKYLGRIGHLHNVDKLMQPRPNVPWALDNGVFGAHQKGSTWSEEPLYQYLDAYGQLAPEWVVVPDWVGDRDETLRRWDKHYNALSSFGVPLAFAAQDGMTPADVPTEASILFVGGTTSWKWRNLRMWTEAFPRVHVGRVNTYRLLWMAHDAGAESCDGTGWFRGDRKQLAGLDQYLQESTNGKKQTEIQLC